MTTLSGYGRMMLGTLSLFFSRLLSPATGQRRINRLAIPAGWQPTT